MKLIPSILSLLLLAQSGDSRWVETLAFWVRSDLHRLDQRTAEIDATLHTLPELTPINSSPSIGFKTEFMPDEEELWVEVALPRTMLVDTVVLVPPLAKGASGVVPGYGFPTRFRIDAFDDHDAPGPVLDATTQDFPNPGCHPVIASFPSRPVKRVRLTATVPWQLDGPPVLALAEMLILAGERNVALGATVTSTSARELPVSWSRRNLVDMVTPLGLPVAPGEPGPAGFHSAVAAQADVVKSVTLTLPAIVPLDDVWLVPVRHREVPLWFDYGFPVRFKIESATTPDFSDAHPIYATTAKFPSPPGMNLLRFAAHQIPARYLRVTATQLWERREDFVFALAEVQVISDGRNVALGARVEATDSLPGDDAWSTAALTDGRTETGPLLSLPAWFAQLQQRRLLEQERAQLMDTRTRLVERAQHTLVNGSIFTALGISFLSAALLWRQRRTRRRDAERLHEKLARDLHDEIGSNLGSIRLICSFASQPDITPEAMRADLIDIERVAAESADSMRDMVQLISPRRTADSHDWLEVLHALTERLLRGHTLDCALPAAPLLRAPDLETRRELYLFCKEVLHNIARHAQATRVRFHLTPTAEGLRVEIRDNGIGFDPQQAGTGNGLSNLRARAHAMHATLHLQSQPGHGTTVQLDVPKPTTGSPAKPCTPPSSASGSSKTTTSSAARSCASPHPRVAWLRRVLLPMPRPCSPRCAPRTPGSAPKSSCSMSACPDAADSTSSAPCMPSLARATSSSSPSSKMKPKSARPSAQEPAGTCSRPRAPMKSPTPSSKPATAAHPCRRKSRAASSSSSPISPAPPLHPSRSPRASANCSP